MDIVDSHDLFKNQWRKRKTFYKKENYKIIYTISTDYTTDLSTWTLIYDPNSKVCKPRKKKVISIKSNSSSDKSIANDSESEDDNEEPEPASKKASKIADDVCFLKC